MSLYRKIRHRISNSFSIAGFASRRMTIFSPAWFAAVSRNIKICTRRRYTPTEAFRLGFFEPGFDTGLLGKFISRKMLTKIQKKLNPMRWQELAKNKGIFYSFCLDAGVTIPKLYLLCHDKNLWTDCINNLQLVSDRQKSEFISEKLPTQFVLKPICSAYGEGVTAFTKADNTFTNSNGQALNTQQLIASLESDYPDAFLIQEKIENHPDIVALTGCQALQTVRLISFIDTEAKTRLLHAHFKPITKPDIIIDTHIEGLIGNVEVPVNIDTGILGPGNRIVDTGQGIITVNEHPFTNKPFKGFTLPDWQDVRRIVTETAPKFLPLRCIGWDVALTPKGPCIIEANVWWDPPNQHMVTDKILKQMAEQHL